MANYNEGQKVLVLKNGWASFIVPKVNKQVGNESKLEVAPKPWYPHTQVVTIVEKKGDFYIVQDDSGKVWPYPIGFWSLTDDLHFYRK